MVIWNRGLTTISRSVLRAFIFIDRYASRLALPCCLAVLALLVILNPQHSLLQYDDDVTIESSPNLNCVDSSILAYCKWNGNEISEERLEVAVKACGLESEVFFRSLSDCSSILASLGSPVEVAVVSSVDVGDIPLPSIVYRHPTPPELVGHVFAVRSFDGSQFQIWDPAISREEVALDTASVNFDSQVLVLTSRVLLRRLWLDDFYWLTIVLSGVAALGIATAWAFKRIRINLSTKNAILFALLCIIGCDSVPTERLVHFDTTNHDFGIVEVEKKIPGVGNASFTEHRFVLRNNDRVDLKIRSVVSGCGCITPSGDLINTIVAPNSSVEIPVSIDVSTKNGFFIESVAVTLEGAVELSETLTLKGFARHLPRPTEDTIDLFSFDGTRTKCETQFTYVRRAEDDASEVEEFAVETKGSDRVDWLGLSSEKRRLVVDGRPGEKVDIWYFSLTYDPSNDHVGEDAYLRVTWKKPIRMESLVPIVCGTKCPVEIDDYFYFPILATDQVQKKILPVKIHSMEAASGIKFVSSSDSVKCSLQPEKKRLEVSFQSVPEGPFSVEISPVLDGINCVPFKIEGFAATKSGLD